MIHLTENLLAVPIPEDAEDISIRTKDGIHYKRLYWNWDKENEGYYQFTPLLPMSAVLFGTVNTETGESDMDGQSTIEYMCMLDIHSGCKGRYAIIKKI